MRWFLYSSVGVFTVFMGVLVAVTYIAHTRQSGSTGMDASTMQDKRREHVVDKGNTEEGPSWLNTNDYQPISRMGR